LSFDSILKALESGRVTPAKAAGILRKAEERLDELLDEAWSVSRRRLRAYRPHPRYPSISITGGWCELDCRHCGRVYLRSMEWAESPELLERRLLKLSSTGAVGCLVSGGYTREGRLPVKPFLKALRRGAEEGLRMNIHPGLVDRETASEIASAGLEAASVDMPGDPETIRWVHGLDAGPRDYLKSMLNLSQAGLKACPHICVGLHGGAVRGELNALRLVHRAGVENLTFIILIPTPGTEFQHVRPPEPRTVAAVAALARLLMPEADIGLGCMRPRGPYSEEVERLLLRAGVDRIVLPRGKTLSEARRLGVRVEWMESCCVIQ